MRKILFTLTLLVAFLPLRAAYYVAGNGTAGNPWCDGKSWTANGSLMAQDNGLATLTFTGVPAGSYQFKITTGTWNTNYGFSRYDLDCSTIQAAGNADGNVCFSTTEAQAITITFDGSRICLTGDGHNELDTAHTRYTGVPTESEAVMLQAFYWDSYTLTTFGRTKWQNLLQDTTYLCRNFDYVWFPPSARSRVRLSLIHI